MPAAISSVAVTQGGFSGAPIAGSTLTEFSQPSASDPEEMVLGEYSGEYTPAAHVGKRRFRFDWQLWLGITLALAGVALIVYLVSVFIIPHG
jgi:hypothetical protein